MKVIFSILAILVFSGCSSKQEIVKAEKLATNSVYHPSYEYHGVQVSDSSNWFLGHGDGLRRENKLYFQHIDNANVYHAGVAQGLANVANTEASGNSLKEQGFQSNGAVSSSCSVANVDGLVSGEKFVFKAHFKTDKTYPYDYESIVNELVKVKPRKVVVRGYTDDIGSDTYNQGLSLKRAAKVKELLQQIPGWGSVVIDAIGEGGCPRLVLNKDDGSRQVNRRAEITVYGETL